MGFGVCLAVAAMAVVTDCRWGRIENRLVFPVLIIGCVVSFYLGGWAGGQQALLGAAAPLVLFPVFVLRMLGAGDIKLLMALGAWLGGAAVGALMVYAVLWGGGMALAVTLVRRDGRRRLNKVAVYLKACVLARKLLPYEDFSRLGEGAALPFAPAIFCGLLTLLAQQHGLLPALY